MSVLTALPVRDHPELPWFGDWAVDAACKGQYSSDERIPDPFFDYGRNDQKIRAVRRVCWSCPVRQECLDANIEVPHGMFGGFTERERMAMLGRGHRRPSNAEAYSFYARTMDIDAAHHPGASRPKRFRAS